MSSFIVKDAILFKDEQNNLYALLRGFDSNITPRHWRWVYPIKYKDIDDFIAEIKGCVIQFEIDILQYFNENKLKEILEMSINQWESIKDTKVILQKYAWCPYCNKKEEEYNRLKEKYEVTIEQLINFCKSKKRWLSIKRINSNSKLCKVNKMIEIYLKNRSYSFIRT